MRTNVAAVNKARTYEGGVARVPKASEQLVRRVATCMLFEDSFYESGAEIAKGIAECAAQVPVEEVAALAIRARDDFKLRHVPLFLLAQLDLRRAERPGLLRATIEQVVQRPDEMAELLAIIQKVSGGRTDCPKCGRPLTRSGANYVCRMNMPFQGCGWTGVVTGKPLKKLVSAQTKRGLAAAFRKFSEYQLSKWSRDREIKLRDVLFLAHPKPKDEAQAEVWKKLANKKLESAETWELVLSSAKEKGLSKKEAWEHVIDMWITEDDGAA